MPRFFGLCDNSLFVSDCESSGYSRLDVVDDSEEKKQRQKQLVSEKLLLEQKKQLSQQVHQMLFGGGFLNAHQQNVDELKKKGGMLSRDEANKLRILEAKTNLLHACRDLLKADPVNKEVRKKKLKKIVCDEMNNKPLPIQEGGKNTKPLFQINTACIRGSDFWREKMGETYSGTYYLVEQTLKLFELPDCKKLSSLSDMTIDELDQLKINL